METKNIFNFLNELSKNNNIEWMHRHKKEFEVAKNEFSQITQSLIDKLTLIDTSLLGLAAKDCIFRIQRDIRFSFDKRPYKEYLSAYIVEGGKKIMKAGYYFQIQPGKQTLIAGGMHVPPQEALNLLRKEILNNGEVLESILIRNEFKENFSALIGDSLKMMPKNFPSQHKYEKYIKMKSYDVIYYYEDDFAQNADILINDMFDKFKLVKPLNDFLNNALMNYVFVPPLKEKNKEK
ncbi:MAG: DUF2461 domain-containing protein [Bacteroidales bacterium]|jgi:uncharacterized protein (TIGR02453 family)|nr:DUF2461 domain-containing protein [Bacteroidales bacterium]